MRDKVEAWSPAVARLPVLPSSALSLTAGFLSLLEGERVRYFSGFGRNGRWMRYRVEANTALQVNEQSFKFQGWGIVMGRVRGVAGERLNS